MNVHFHDAAKMTIEAKTGAMIGMASIIIRTDLLFFGKNHDMFSSGWICVVKMDGTGTGNTGIFTAAWELLLASLGWLFLHPCFCRCGVGGEIFSDHYIHAGCE